MLVPPEDDLIDRIYDASFEPARWIGVMERLCDKIHGQAACLTELDIIDGFGAGVSARSDPESVDDYLAHWTHKNSLLIVDDPVQYSRDWHLGIVRDQEWCAPEILHKTSYYNEFLRPLGAEHSIFARLSLNGTMVTAMNIARAHGKGPFEDREIEIAARYQPHLIRAISLGRRLQLTHAALDQLDILLETSAKALLFVNGRGLVRHHTAAVEALMRRTGALTLRQGRLHAADPEEDARLHRLIAMVIAGADLPTDPSIQIRSADGGETVVMSVSLLSRRSVAAFSVEPLILIGLVVKPAVLAPAERLRTTYQLTAAEARVALLLGEGMKLQQIAVHCGSSVHTVRAQLGAIFLKTGCHRQADLVRFLLQHGMVGARLPS